MDKYRSKAELIMRTGNSLIAEKRRRSAIIRRSVYSVSGFCAAVAIGFGAWNIKGMKDAPDPEKFTSAVEHSAVTTAAEDRTSAVTIPAKVTTDNVTCTSKKYVTTTAAETVSPVVSTFAPSPKTTAPRVTSASPQTSAKPAQMTAIATTFLTSSAAENRFPTAVEVPTTPADKIVRRSIDDLMGRRYKCIADMPVPAENLGELLGVSKVREDYYSSLGVYENTLCYDAEIYEISGFSADFAIAVKSFDDDKFLVFNNNEHFPATLGDLLNDCGLREHLTFDSAEYFSGTDYDMYSVNDGSRVFEMLFGGDDARTYRYTDLPLEQMMPRLTFQCELHGIYRDPISIGVSEKGVLTVNLNGIGMAFVIGEERADAVINEIIQGSENDPGNGYIPEIPT